MAGILESQQRVRRGRIPGFKMGGDGRVRILKTVIAAAVALAIGIFLYRYVRAPHDGFASERVTMLVSIDPSLSARVQLKDGRLNVQVTESAGPRPRPAAGTGLDFEMEIGINGLKRLIDGLGGILVNIPETIEYRGADGLPVRIDAGMRRLDADRVESYLRRQNASRPASLRAAVLGVTSRASELMVSGVDLDRILEAALEPSARGADGRNAARLAALLRSASSLGPTEISVEWGAAPFGAEPLVRVDAPSLSGGATSPVDDGATRTTVAPPGNAFPVSRVTSPVKVRILNGTGKPGLAARAAFNLPSPRFEVIETANADRFGYARTVIRSPDASAAQEVMGILGVGRLEVKPGETLRGADIEVILGSDARNRW